MTLIARPAEICSFRRGSRNLLLHPPTCAWLVCDDGAARWYDALPALPETLSFERKTAATQQHYFASVFWDAGLLWQNGRAKYSPDLFTDDVRSLNTVVFNVTNGCNLRCRYCYANSTKGKQMPFSVVRRTLDFVSASSNYISIQFSGNGEPLVNWPLLRESLLYCDQLRERGKEIKISVQTNGTLITREIASILKRHVDKTIISIDGPKELTNRHRIFANGRGAYDSIVHGIEILEEVETPYELSATVAAYEDLPVVVEWLLQSGARFVAHNFLWPQGRGEACEIRGRTAQAWLNLHVDLVKRLLEHNRDATQPVTHRRVRQWVTNLVSKKRMSKCLRSPCGAGTEMISVDADGNVYPCHAMTTPPLAIGNVMQLDRQDPAALTRLQTASRLVGCITGVRVEAVKECSGCPFRYACGGPCANVIYTRYKRIINELPQECGVRKRIWEELAWALTENPNHPFLLVGLKPGTKFRKAQAA